jgi:hypothetical protein
MCFSLARAERRLWAVFLAGSIAFPYSLWRRQTLACNTRVSALGDANRYILLGVAMIVGADTGRSLLGTVNSGEGNAYAAESICGEWSRSICGAR